MKRILLAVLALGAAAVLSMSSAKQTDIGGLLPVQTLLVTRTAGQYVLDGGENLRGYGETWALAMDDLIAGAPGEAFFGCTGHVVFDRSAVGALPHALRDERLRPAARLYLSVGAVEADGATAFLNTHSGEKTIQTLMADMLEGRTLRLPLLVCEEGRYRLRDE